MGYKFIKFQAKDSIARITLNRPEVLNSFNREMAQEVQKALESVKSDDTIRAVLLTGEGRAFCAGQDLSEVSPAERDTPPDIGEIVRESYNPIIRAIRNLEKPVIAAVNGTAAGAGANIALACDIVIASDKTVFIQSFCHVGLIPDSGGTFFLPRLVGFSRASAMAMLGEKIDAQTALEYGMIYKMVGSENLMDEALKLAERLAAMPTKGLGLIKNAFNKSFTNDLDAQLDYEEELQRQAGRTYDYSEGVKAFLEKRKPQFRGN